MNATLDYVIQLNENWSLYAENFTATVVASTTSKLSLWHKIQISLYLIILVLAVIGNTLIILTLAQNRRMRTVTNLFLLNLAISDLFLGVLCIPFTLIGSVLRDFVFGRTMCHVLPFLQACSVSVGAWTLVAISVERYYAICHPLRSLAWQTISHAYKTILAIWIGTLISMSPIAIFSELQNTNRGNHKCRESFPPHYDKVFNMFLNIFLLLIPLLILLATYSLIVKTLWNGIRNERALRSNVDIYVNLRTNTSSSTRWKFKSHTNVATRQPSHWTTLRNWSDDSNNSPNSTNSSKRLTTGLRRTNAERSLCNKKRVIKMLCVVVLEFFVCWTPLYVMNTIFLYDANLVYNNIGLTGVGLLQFLAYTSSCCNPITYCFMNGGFRKSFLKLFRCFKASSNSYRSQFRVEGSDCQMDLKYSNQRGSEN